MSYKEFREWANKQTVVFFNGHKECVGKWVDCFGNRDRSILWLDAFLAQNCPFEFILEDIKYYCPEGTFESLKHINIQEDLPETFKVGRKIKIHTKKGKKGAIDNLGWLSLKSNDRFGYCDSTNSWIPPYISYPAMYYYKYFKSKKAIVRHLRKQKLPPRISFTAYNADTNETHLIIIK